MRRLLPIAAAVFVSACMAGRDYARPAVVLPAEFRGNAPAADAGAPSIADAPWWELFQDEQLQGLIRTALERNYDLRIAAARILEAQAQVGITRADQYPTADVGAAVLGQKSPALSGSSTSKSVGGMVVQGSAGWQLDFWGRYRRASESARAQLFATGWARRAIVTTLISDVADAYFGLRALDLQLDVARRTLGNRQESLRLTTIRERGGATSMLDVRQAEQLVYGASAQIANLERSIEQQENFISILLGDLPAGVTRGIALSEQPRAADVPPGLPSTLLERRPDIQRAEQLLVAANAEVGVAKAAYFPQISLTGSGGLESAALSALFSGGATIWTGALSALQPVFTGGRLRSRVELAEASRQETELVYLQTVQRAFGEVSDALVGYRKLREFREQQRLLVDSSQDARRLADLRYQGGVTSYLEVLDADTRLFVAELGLAEAERSELTGLVEIYRALGGGWQQ